MTEPSTILYNHDNTVLKYVPIDVDDAVLELQKNA